MFFLLAILISTSAWAGQAALPAGVPNVFDAEVRAQFEPVGVFNLRGDPDFPVVILMNKGGEQPQAIFFGMDARNGKDTWSLATDPIILIVLFADPSTILGLHVDAGFMDRGRPSGQYKAVDDPNSFALPDLLKAVTAVPTQSYM